MAAYPPRPATERNITDGHIDGFAELFGSLTTRWIKVERLQHYDESDSPGYQAFLRGDHVEAARLVEEFVRSQAAFYDFAKRRGVRLVRILTLSPYVNYPPMNGRAGGSIPYWMRGDAACGRLTAPQPSTPRWAMLRAAL
jgi:hypothetical protein